MISVERYTQLKSRVDRLWRDANRAEGALLQLMEQLEGEFGSKSLKEAERLKAKLDKELERTEVKYDEQMSDFETEWEGVLGD